MDTQKRAMPGLKQLVIELCGSNPTLISSLHHGLNETPLQGLYPAYLNLDEVVAFEASSWKRREIDPHFFPGFVGSADLYKIFREVLQIGHPWLNKYRTQTFSGSTSALHEKLNPFSEQNLRERLEQVEKGPELMLTDCLCQEINEYVFECQYAERKHERGGDNYKLIIMEFQPLYPKRETIVPNYASEIARIISRYHERQGAQCSNHPAELLKTKTPKQLSLF